MKDPCDGCRFFYTWMDWHCITCSEDGDMFQPQQKELDFNTDIDLKTPKAEGRTK
jgi:hypothetical protein